MIKFTVAAVIAAGLTHAASVHQINQLGYDEDGQSLLDIETGHSDILFNETSEIDWSHPTAQTNLEAKNFVAGFAQMGFRMHRESERDRRGNKLGDLVASLVIE